MRAVAGCIGFITLNMLLIAYAAFEAHMPVTGIFEDIGEPVNRLTGIVDPDLDEITVYIAAAVADDLLQSFCLVNFEFGEFLKALKLELRINCADVFFYFSRRFRFFDNENFGTFFSRRHRCNPAAGAAPDNQDFRIQNFGNITIGDLGSFAEPVGRVGFLLTQHNFLAGSLGDTVGCRGFNSIRCNGCSGNGVYIRSLPAEDSLCHLITDFTADVRRFTGNVNLNVGNGTAVKCHGYFDIT